MLDWISDINDRINAGLDRLAVLPLAFIAVLGFFVLATVTLENDTGTVAAEKLTRIAS